VVSIVRKRKDWCRMAKPSVPRKTKEASAQAAAFGRALYALRIEKKLSQEELSFQSEIDRSYLGQLERGEKEPCLGVIFKIADALATPPSEIFRTIEHLRKEQPIPVKRNARVR
jgi:transcriptional regulator with XRE-family HTH domain